MQQLSENPTMSQREHFSYEMWIAESACLNCGWRPIEGMRQYLLIFGCRAECMRCELPLPSVTSIL